MIYFVFKAILSGLIIAAVSAIARRSPVFGALVASLPFISILAVIWLWHDTHDKPLIENHLQATFWYVLPSLPMFLVAPALMRAGFDVGSALIASCGVTLALYLLIVPVAAFFEMRL